VLLLLKAASSPHEAPFHPLHHHQHQQQLLLAAQSAVAS
jgi:hypothetical protein